MPRRAEIKGAGRSPYFDQDCPQPRTANSFRCRAQGAFGIARPYHDQGLRVYPESDETRSMEPSGFSIHEIRPHGDDRALCGRPQSQPQAKPCRRHPVGFGFGKYLVEAPAYQATSERRIDFIKAQSKAIGDPWNRALLKPGKGMPEG